MVIEVIIYKRCRLNIRLLVWYIWPIKESYGDSYYWEGPARQKIQVKYDEVKAKGLQWNNDWSIEHEQTASRVLREKVTIKWLCFELTFTYWRINLFGKAFPKYHGWNKIKKSCT